MEQALEIQRLKLLRLLAGWIAVVEWVLVAPFIGGLPHWMRVFLGSVLTRAELAAQQLIFVSACVQARPGFALARSGSVAFDASGAEDGSTDEVLATKALVRRMKALHVLLEDLPRQGRRLLRRAAKRRSCAVADGWRRLGEERFTVAPCGMRDKALPTRRIERPPDKCLEGFGVPFYLPPNAGGRRRRLAEGV